MIDVTSDQGQVLLGTIFGDGYLQNRRNTRKATISIKHSIAQKEYLEWKISQLGFEGKLSPTPLRKPTKYVFQSHRRRDLYPFWKAFYPNGKKTLSLKYLGKIEPLALAVWYCDDGNYNYWTKVVSLNTQSYSKEENELIKRYFQGYFGMTCSVVMQHIRGYDPYYFLNFTRASSNRLLELVKPYIVKIECMHYKLGHLLKKNLTKLGQKKEKKRKYRREYYWENRDRILKRRRLRRRSKGLIPKPHWSHKEMKCLKENYLSLTDQEISRKLGRSKPSVTQKRLRLGLRKR